MGVTVVRWENSGWLQPPSEKWKGRRGAGVALHVREMFEHVKVSDGDHKFHQMDRNDLETTGPQSWESTGMSLPGNCSKPNEAGDWEKPAEATKGKSSLTYLCLLLQKCNTFLQKK